MSFKSEISPFCARPGRARLLAMALAFSLTAACSAPKTAPPATNTATSETSRASLEQVRRTVEALRPVGVALDAPQPGDWRERFTEPPQTLDEYLASDPTVAREDRRKLYVQPLGTFSPARRKIVTLTAEFLGDYFGLEVVTLPDRLLDTVPFDSQREGLTGRQILAGYIVDRMLAPEVPADGAVLVGLTDVDLYPEPAWNFVFGVANLKARAGVWSMARFGYPDDGPGAFRECLLRTLKIATHETGHAFSLPHCVLYRCSMNGSNSLDETDKCPLDLCPECTGKLTWATGADARTRLERIAEFCRKNGLRPEEALARRSLEALTKPAVPRAAA